MSHLEQTIQSQEHHKNKNNHGFVNLPLPNNHLSTEHHNNNVSRKMRAPNHGMELLKVMDLNRGR